MATSISARWPYLLAATICGLTISVYQQSSVAFLKPMWSSPADYKFTAIYVGAYVITALTMIQWRNRYNQKFGWVVTAILGAFLCALADEYSSRTDTDAVFIGLSFLPFTLVFYSLIALPIMGFTTLIMRALGKENPVFDD